VNYPKNLINPSQKGNCPALRAVKVPLLPQSRTAREKNAATDAINIAGAAP
jgi:hypothetical protein